MPEGTKKRERRKPPRSAEVKTTKEAKQWGERRQAELLLHIKPRPKGVPTLAQFADRFVEEYAVANRQKASTIASKKNSLKNHLVPLLGTKKLDEVKNQDVQHLKAKLHELKPKTVNGVLNVLSKLLKVAVEWGVIDVMPCTIRLLKSAAPTMPFYDFDDYARLVEAAEKLGPSVLAMVLLGGDAGLRRGEIIALEWGDIDLRRGVLTVARSSWNGQVDSPKNGHSRQVDLTVRLAQALKAIRHLRGDRVLYDHEQPVNETVLHRWMESCQRRAGLGKGKRGLHVLRHSFCSHLAMQGAPAKAIQELAGHSDLTMTMRYMHLSPSSKKSAIQLLDHRPTGVDDEHTEEVKNEPERRPAVETFVETLAPT